MSTVTIRWDNDEYIQIEVDGTEVVSANHDEHGWAGMQAVIDAATGVAKALGAEVRTDGTPNL